MSADPLTVQELAHRLRALAHRAAPFVDTLRGCSPDERWVLRGFVSAVASAADILSPAGSLDGAEPCEPAPLLRWLSEHPQNGAAA